MQQSDGCSKSNDSSIDDKGGSGNCEFDIGDDIVAKLTLSKKTIKMLFQFQKELLQCKQYRIEDLNNTLDLIKYYFVKLQAGITFIEEGECLEDAIQEFKQLIRDNYQIKEKLTIWIKEEQKLYNVDKLFQILNNETNLNNQDESNCAKWKSKSLTISTLTINPNKIKIDKNNTLLFASDTFSIKLYGFNSRRKLIKTLIQHQGIIIDLLWLKKSEQLLSIGLDSDIIIWNNHSQPQQILKDEINPINSIIANDKDEFFTGGQKYIKFWKKKDSTWNCTQTIDIEILITNFRFNASQTKLILQGYQYDINRDGDDDDYIRNYIILIELQDELWIITRKINIDRFLYSQSYKVFLTENNQFVFLHQTFGIIETFNYKPETEELIRTQLIQYSNCFNQMDCTQSQFIRDSNTIMVSHNDIIYFFQQGSQGQFFPLQSIQFDKGLTKIVISENRKYLIIIEDDWNINKISILKLRNIE